jgi:hypothetical protein
MRHPYSTNSEEHRHVPLYLAALSIIVSLALAGLFRRLDWLPPLWLDVSSVVFLYGVFYTLFKKYGWKWGWLRGLTRISTPILSGEWVGIVQSNFDGAIGAEHAVTVTIGQDWTEILIRLSAPNSKSHSLSASMVVTEDECILIYDYLNEPQQNAAQTMHMHRGTARLILTANDRLEGDYYTGRDRNNIGIIRLQRSRTPA